MIGGFAPGATPIGGGGPLPTRGAGEAAAAGRQGPPPPQRDRAARAETDGAASPAPRP